MFKFKRFLVNDDRCAMKVGTDGVLLGAWCNASEYARILDVGTGCGLVALMLAQRFPEAYISAVELDEEAAGQAAENFASSPFSTRLKVMATDFLTIESESVYDAIVTNPPFFEEDLLPPDAARARARHTSTGLTFDRLISKSSTLLRTGGTLTVIIPKVAQARFHASANEKGFVLRRATDVRTVVRKSPKRVLLEFQKGSVGDNRVESSVVVRNELILMEDGRRSDAYAALCHEFYL